jgi:hypothetical protein
MHISGRKPEAKAVAGVPRESSSGSDNLVGAIRCASKVLAGWPNARKYNNQRYDNGSLGLGLVYVVLLVSPTGNLNGDTQIFTFPIDLCVLAIP